MYLAYEWAMLGFESASVMNKRLAKIGRGGAQAADEVSLMFAEKASAFQEASMAMIWGQTALGTVSRYREHVAANEVRLSI